jgi:hypothetical protein
MCITYCTSRSRRLNVITPLLGVLVRGPCDQAASETREDLAPSPPASEVVGNALMYMAALRQVAAERLQ